MKLVWTANAKSNLRAIHDYIAAQSPHYARGMVDRITSKTRHLVKHPEMGGHVAEYADDAIRELIEWPYRIIYAVRSDRIEILSVAHGARELPPP